MKYFLTVMIMAAALPVWGDDEPAAKVVPLKTLRKSAYREAVEARDRADLRLADVEKRLSESRRAANSFRFTDEELKRFQSNIDEVFQDFQDVVDRYPHTEIACYCAQRLAGFQQFLGKFDDAARMMQDVAAEYAGTSVEPQLVFSIGLMEAQARDNQAEAIRWFSRVPRPLDMPVKRPPDVNPNHLPEQRQRFLSAQQQIVKAALKLGLDAQAQARLDALKQEFPNRAEELDRFYKFEVGSIASGASTSKPPDGFVIPDIVDAKPVVVEAATSLATDVVRLGRLRGGLDEDAALAALVKHGDPVVAEIERQIADEGPDFGMVHRSVIVLKQIDSESSRDLLLRIARGDFQLENPNLEPWAASNLIKLDQAVGWALLGSTNRDVLTAALNSVEDQKLDVQRVSSLKQCLKHDNDLVRWRAAEVLARSPHGKLADEAFAAITEVLIGVADLPRRDEPKMRTHPPTTEQTVAEAHYFRYIGALAKVQVDKAALHQFAKQHDGRVRDVAVLALARRHDSSVREQIIQLAQNSDAGLFRAWAVHILAETGTSQDLPLLRKLAKEDPLVRRGPLPPPHGLHATGPMHPVREAAADAIRRIEKRKKDGPNPKAA